MKLLLILFLLIPSMADAATYFVRTGGSTSTNCTGLADADYDGSGTGEACAFNHPNWALELNGQTAGALSGSDTLVIVNGEYRIGCMGLSADCRDATVNITNSTCDADFPFDCYPNAVPDGSSGNPTIIIGCSTSGCSNPADRPELWGAGRIPQVINLAGSDYVTVQDLEITDHADCGYNHPLYACGSADADELSANRGVDITGATNIILKNLNIHGMYVYGIYGGGVSAIRLDNTKSNYNPFGGWEGDSCSGAGTCGATGAIDIVNGSQINGNGCVEDSSAPGTIKAEGCFSQDQGGYGDGIGFGNTGGAWTVTDSEINNNVSDGIDLLYMNNGSYSGGTVTIKRSRFEGNAGNQIKVPNAATIEDNAILGNCGYFHEQLFTLYDKQAAGRSGTGCNNNGTCEATENSTDCPCTDSSDGCGTGGVEGDCTGFNHCRASGNTVELAFKSGDSTVPKLYNNTILCNGDVAIDTSGTCTTGNDVEVRNNILYGGREFNDDTSINAAGGNDSCSVYFDASGTCDTDFIDTTNVCYAFKEGTPCASSTNADPVFTGTVLQGPYTSPGYYSGTDYVSLVTLQVTSPAIDYASESYGDSADYNNYNRGASWDSGAIEYGSSTTNSTSQLTGRIQITGAVQVK